LDDIDKANEVDIKDFINAKLNAFSLAPVIAQEDLLTNSYLEDS